MKKKPPRKLSLPARRVLGLLRQPWLTDSGTLELLSEIAERTSAPDFEAVLAKRGQRLERTDSVLMREGVAVLPVHGPIFRYANLFTDLSGATSIEMLAKDFRAALDNSKVSAIVLDIDSPGGQVNGVSEFAQMVRAGTRVKPVTAYVGGMAASGGYWIASAASSILVADTAVLGSIGVVVGMYVEDDETYVEIVSTQSPGKRPNVRTTEGRAQIQSDVDALANVFINTVARNRSVMAERVLSDFGRGGVLIGQAAVDAGMADGVSTLEALIAQRARKPEPPRPTDPADPRARLPPAAELIMSYGHDAALALLGKRIAAERAKQ